MNASAPVATLDQGDFVQVVRDALRRDYGRFSYPVKRIAQAANTNVRTATNWWRGVCAPGGLHLLKLMAHSTELAGEVRRLTSMDADLDPNFPRELETALKAYAKAKGWGP